MRNRWLAAGGLTAVAFAAAACGTNSYGSPGTGSASTGSSPSGQAAVPSSSAAVTLKIEKTTAGTILTSAGGYVLYYFTEDKASSGTSTCTGSCASTWPPLTGTVQPPPGATMPGPLGMITRADGTKQVTINGYPIYLYSGDQTPGQANGNGAGGKWHVVPVTGSASASTSPTSASTGSSSGSGGGGGY
jgi:predicted lipoprotein with Yx(FWY)xxD motif